MIIIYDFDGTLNPYPLPQNDNDPYNWASENKVPYNYIYVLANDNL